MSVYKLVKLSSQSIQFFNCERYVLKDKVTEFSLSKKEQSKKFKLFPGEPSHAGSKLLTHFITIKISSLENILKSEVYVFT